MIEANTSDHKFINHLTEIILANLSNENFDVKELVNLSGKSYFSLSRRLFSITQKTLNQFIRETRLKKSMEILKSSDVTASEVSYLVGFGSPAYFNKCFHKYFGYPPGEVNKRKVFRFINVKWIYNILKNKFRKTVRLSYASFSSFILIIILFFYIAFDGFFIGSSADSEPHIKTEEISIAVIPFKNRSNSIHDHYFIEGLMEEISTSLSKIHYVTVISRATVEKLCEGSLAASEIGKKLNVKYIIEGSGQKCNNKFVLRIQLIETKSEKHIWAESYDGEVNDSSDIISVQSRVAHTVAAALQTIVAPREKQIIEKPNSSNLTAYNFYIRGGVELRKYINDRKNKEALCRAEEMYNNALEYDSAFAMAYVGLANVYLNKHLFKSYFPEDHLDSVLVFANRALYYDNHLAEAYYARGQYYMQTGKTKQTLKEYDKALEFNPGYWEVYWFRGWHVYIQDYFRMDFIKAIEYLHKSVDLNHEKELPYFLYELGDAYAAYAGFPEKSLSFYQEALKLDGDTTKYFHCLADDESVLRNYEKAIELYKKCYERDSTSVEIASGLATAYYLVGRYSESLKYVRKFEDRIEELSNLFHGSMDMIGYVYWLNGYKKEAYNWFSRQKQISEEYINKSNSYSINANYDLAVVNIFMGEKEKAYNNLRILAKISVCPLWLVSSIKDDPLFNSIRNDTEFQRIVSTLESKYQAEHARVGKWLEEQGSL